MNDWFDDSSCSTTGKQGLFKDCGRVLDHPIVVGSFRSSVGKCRQEIQQIGTFLVYSQ